MSKIIDQLKKLVKLEKLKSILKYFKDEKLSTDNLNTFMKKKQNIWGCVVILIMLVTFFILHAFAQTKSQPVVQKEQKQNTNMPDGVVSSDFTEKDSESAMEMQQQEIDKLKKNVNKMMEGDKKNNGDATSAGGSTPITVPNAASPISSAPQSAQNANTVAAQDAQFNHPLTTLSFHYHSPVNITQSINAGRTRSRNSATQQVQTIKNLKTPKTWVPAGTFSRVVLLEGADANASVNGQSDTTPILMRFLDPGTLPNGFHSHLKGCVALASIYGDISSERGEARLNKLSCTKKDGSILEIPVEGYISFAGKEGIRGVPVMRNGQILTMAGISGALSGFGSALAQGQQTQSISPLGVTSTVTGSQIFKSGAYTGASTAMGELASYYIKRADQYHPIISIGSGTVATVIFQTGFSLIPKVNSDNNGNSDAAGNNVQNTQSTQNTGSNNASEVKALLQQEQTTAQLSQQSTQNINNQSSPFSNVSQTQMGQSVTNDTGVNNVSSN